MEMEKYELKYQGVHKFVFKWKTTVQQGVTIVKKKLATLPAC